MLNKLDQYLVEAGRERSGFGLEPRLNLSQVGRAGWTDFMRNWEDAGATHLAVNTMGCGYNSVGAHLEALQQVAKDFGLN
jgi:hypothetical protein